MKQYNRIMLGAGGKYVDECLAGGYIGANFIPNINLTATNFDDDSAWRLQRVEEYLKANPDKSPQTAHMSIAFLYTICYGLKQGDIVLASNGQGGYHVAQITGPYYFAKGGNLPHRRPVQWLGKTIARTDMSQKLQNSSGSIGTCCNITKYASELESLIGNFEPIAPQPTPAPVPTPTPKHQDYLERDLHPLLAHHLDKASIYAKTIYNEKSIKSKATNEWVHPDMVGVRFNEFQDDATRALLRAADTKDYIELYSYELKRRIEGDHDLKQYFFQALSNSSWANYGYLVAFEIDDSVRDELERLNRAFGIGVIHLSADGANVLYPARKNELDYYTIDKLCKLNRDFKQFISHTTTLLSAEPKYMNAVRNDFKNFCDQGFNNDNELRAYCDQKHIPY